MSNSCTVGNFVSFYIIRIAVGDGFVKKYFVNFCIINGFKYDKFSMVKKISRVNKLIVIVFFIR